MSYSYTSSDTFTITHARHIASRMASDFRLMRLYYGKPSEEMIENYLEEVAQLFAKGYLDTFEVGFRRGQKRVFSLFYKARADGALSDDRAGGVPAGADVGGANQFSYLTYSTSWHSLTQNQRDAFRAKLPIHRTGSPEPEDGDGYWVSSDRSYAAGGTGVRRRRFVPR
ncbi:MAG: hypothetical protein M3R38_05925 [Actinomycetota bacterium]|nr:hypothetical protein [Actinomycetota bacterium]